MIDIGLPVALRIRAVVARLGRNLRDDRRVERIRRQRHEHFVAFVDERVEYEIDPFGRTGGQEHAIGRRGDTLRGVVRRHRFARGQDTG